MRGFAAGGMPEWNQAWTPDVPSYGDQGRDFGREILYYNPAAVAEEEKAVAAKPAEIKPVVDDSPRGNDGVGGDYKGSGVGFPGSTVNEMGNSGPTTGIASAANSLAATLGNLGLVSLSDAIARNVDPNYGHEGRGALGSGVDADTGLQGQGAAGQTGLYGDAAAGFGGVSSVGSEGQSADFGDKGDVLASGGSVGHYASGGLGTLGSYSDGGRLLRGPGDGVSDSIPATIGHKRMPARLADGEFVVPARIVSELGNGSTEAGARKLYAMMDRIQKQRKQSIGNGRVAVNSRADRHLPA